MRRRLWSVVTTAILAPGIVLAVPSTLEISEQYSTALQQRFQNHLNQIFGQDKSQVFVNVEVGFPPELQKEFQGALKAFLNWQMELMAKTREDQEEARARKKAEAAAKEAASVKKVEPEPAAEPPPADANPFPLPDLTAPDASAPPYILPGYVLRRMSALKEAAPPGEEGSGDQTQDANATANPKVEIYNTGDDKKEPGVSFSMQPILPFSDPAFLYSIGSKIKKVHVRVVLDDSLPADSEVKVQALVANAVEFDPNRGDELNINRMHLVPTRPKEILMAGAAKLLGDPKFLTPIIQWLAMGTLIFMGLVMGSLLLRNLNLNLDLGSLPSWTGGALSIEHQQNRALEIDQRTQRRPEELPAPTPGAALSHGAAVHPEATIDIPPDKIGDLVALVGNTQPSRIALIASRLKPEISAEFLKRFDGEKLSGILAAMANPQYVEPVILAKLKEEIEKRMQGLVGGQDGILRMLTMPDQIARVRILRSIEAKDPKLYRQLRTKVLFMEDLERFEDHDLSVVLQKISAEDLSIIIRDPETMQTTKDKILSCLARRTAQVVSERSALGDQPAADVISQMQGKFLILAESMIAQGIIKPPAEAAAA